VFDEKSPTLIRLTRAVFGPPTGARARLQDRLLVALSRRRALSPTHRPDVTEEDKVFLGFLSFSSSLAFLLLVVIQTTPALAARTMADLPDRFVQLTLNRRPPTPEPEPPPAELESPAAAAPKVLETQEKEPAQTADAEGAADAGEDSQTPEDTEVERSHLIAALLGTLGEAGTDDRIRDLFDDDDPGGANLDRLLAEVDGVQRAGLGLTLRRAQGEYGRADIGELARKDLTCCIKPPSDGPTIDPTITGHPTLPSHYPGDSDVVREAVRRQLAQVKACYEHSLKSNPEIQGRMELDFAVEGGRVIAADVLLNETGDADLAACVARKVSRWRFPAEVTTDVTWPLIFTR